MGAHTAWSPVEIPLVSDLCVHPPRTMNLYLPVTGSRPADFPLLFCAPSLLVTCPPPPSPLVIRSSQTPKGIFPSLSIFFSFSFFSLFSWDGGGGGGGKARPPPPPPLDPPMHFRDWRQAPMTWFPLTVPWGS